MFCYSTLLLSTSFRWFEKRRLLNSHILVESIVLKTNTQPRHQKLVLWSFYILYSTGDSIWEGGNMLETVWKIRGYLKKIELTRIKQMSFSWVNLWRGETPSGGLWGGNDLRSDIPLQPRDEKSWKAHVWKGEKSSNRLVWKGGNIGLEDASSTNITVWKIILFLQWLRLSGSFALRSRVFGAAICWRGSIHITAKQMLLDPSND